MVDQTELPNCFRLYDVVRLIISRGLMNTMQFLMVMRQQKTDGGKKDLESICSVQFPQVLVTGRSSQKTLDI